MNALTVQSVRDAFAEYGIYHRLTRAKTGRTIAFVDVPGSVIVSLDGEAHLITSPDAPIVKFKDADDLAQAVWAYLAGFDTNDQGSTK